jgi:HEAT repeat protein
VQAYAAWALATARDPRAVPDLLGLMRHSIWRMRAMAAYALRESGDDRAEAAMHRALTDPAWQVRVEAVKYFGARGGPMMSERLEPRLGDRHIVVRLAAANALTR